MAAWSLLEASTEQRRQHITLTQVPLSLARPASGSSSPSDSVKRQSKNILFSSVSQTSLVNTASSCPVSPITSY